MPRIPTRTEPYASPARQQRHFKAKRDQILRALGKAAYINGSHFAIMWVSARGDVETYASEAFQNRLGGWFGKGGSGEEMEGIAAEARGLVLGARAGEDMEKRREESWDFEEDDESRGDVEDDVFLDVTKGRVPDMDSVLDQAETTKGKGKRPAPLNTAIANQHFLRTRIDEPRSAPLFLTNLNPPRSSTPLLPRPTSLQPRPAGPTTPTLHIVLPDLTARTAFLHLRFAQLQQSVCKIVAKAWIKIIEPKKQTRCPYNKGESGKPSWWPEGVRHKEPDHLMKAERNTLLLTILRSEKVKVARLQLATAEVVALIRADKAALLMDVYRVAREEEGLRERGEEGEVRVGVSTLVGWDGVDDGMGEETGVTPENVNEGGKGKKRRASAMVKSNSTGGVDVGKKRRSIASSHSSAEVTTRPLPHAPSSSTGDAFGTPHGQLPIGLGLVANHAASSFGGGVAMPRSHSFSAFPSTSSDFGHDTTGSACPTNASPWPPALFPFTEVNGLVTPLTASTIIDPSFPTQHHHPDPAAFYYPPPPHAFAYPAPVLQDFSAPQYNALGLENWSFANMLPDLSWPSQPQSGDVSFSFDTLNSGPRTPSPSPPEDGGGLRLNLGKPRAPPGAVGGGEQPFWLGAGGGQFEGHSQQR